MTGWVDCAAVDGTRPPAEAMSEAELQSVVIDLARRLGYKVAHFRSVRSGGRWLVPVAADGSGFPDLVLVGRGHVVFAELKSDNEQLRGAQRSWMYALIAANADAYVWRPHDYESGAIEAVLSCEG